MAYKGKFKVKEAKKEKRNVRKDKNGRAYIMYGGKKRYIGGY